jgi:hypothetical protein
MSDTTDHPRAGFMRVGFIGLGSQGGPMARRIIEAGYPVTLWARRPATLEPFAAGDVASWIDPRYQRRMRVEHRMNATEQGTAAAPNLLHGDVEPFAPLPYFWTDQYHVKIQVHGYPSPGSEAAIEEGSPADDRFVALYRIDGAPTAVLGWNARRGCPIPQASARVSAPDLVPPRGEQFRRS